MHSEVCAIKKVTTIRKDQHASYCSVCGMPLFLGSGYHAESEVQTIRLRRF